MQKTLLLIWTAVFILNFCVDSVVLLAVSFVFTVGAAIVASDKIKNLPKDTAFPTDHARDMAFPPYKTTCNLLLIWGILGTLTFTLFSWVMLWLVHSTFSRPFQFDLETVIMETYFLVLFVMSQSSPLYIVHSLNSYKDIDRNAKWHQARIKTRYDAIQ